MMVNDQMTELTQNLVNQFSDIIFHEQGFKEMENDITNFNQ